jgi:hypothetical protein
MESGSAGARRDGHLERRGAGSGADGEFLADATDGAAALGQRRRGRGHRRELAMAGRLCVRGSGSGAGLRLGIVGGWTMIHNSHLLDKDCGGPPPLGIC